MDRSVDSIGSCSLDVDADSTDFSDTSGSLNLVTPSSGKDIPREFTSRIKERCQLAQINFHQQTAVVLDPNSGKINTVVSCNPIATAESPLSSPAKKPSYLNLACCVNGYSNLTTYDSKLRQNINKSREVSPIRPSTNNNSNNAQANRLSGNFLAVPLSAYGQRSPQSTSSSSPSSVIGKGAATNNMENRHVFSQVHEHSVDTTDNFSGEMYFKSSKFISSANLKSSAADTIENDSKTAKSFIQQRVERLYGPGALAQGFYSPKKTKSQEISILSERSANSQIKYSTKTIQLEREITSTTINGKTATTTTTTTLERSAANAAAESENCENSYQNGCCDLPVLRHLRPEFRAQLPIVSPKRSPNNKNSVNESSSCPSLQNGTALHVNGTSNSNGSSSSNNNNNNIKSIANDKLATGTPITVHYSSYTTNGTVNVDTRAENKTIVPEPVAALIINSSDSKSSSSMKVTQESECDKEELLSSSLQKQSSSVPVPEKLAEAVMTAETVANRTTTDMKKSSGHAASQTSAVEAKPAAASEESCSVRDGNYFLKVLKTEQDRLLRMADDTEKELETLLGSSATVSDEIFGYLRSALGKARLLATQKMKQFEGLCINNLNQLPDEKFPTTNEDLQGFWDMVMLQVTHVDSLFKEIENLRANNWQKLPQQVPIAPQGSKLTRRPNAAAKSSNSSTNSSVINGGTNAKKPSAASILSVQRREAQRKQLMEMKRKNKLAMQSNTSLTTSSSEQLQQQQQQQSNQNQVVEIFVNDQSGNSS